MVSDFLVLNDDPFFQLNDSEYKSATKKYPELLNNKFYLENSATIHLEPGKTKDGYINNSMILEPFERLFKLIEFKASFKNKRVRIIVDNATTHSAKEYSINEFSM